MHTICEFMKASITTTSFFALIERSLITIFWLKCGIWKGDLMSLLLFIAILKFLSQWLHDVVDEGKLELYSQGNILVELHLACADDVVFFCKATRGSMEALKEILDEYSSHTRMEVNREKSYMILSTNMGAKADGLRNILGFSSKSLPLSHLGSSIICRKGDKGQRLWWDDQFTTRVC